MLISLKTNVIAKSGLSQWSYGITYVYTLCSYVPDTTSTQLKANCNCNTNKCLVIADVTNAQVGLSSKIVAKFLVFG